MKDVGLCGETTSKGVQYSQTRNAGHLLERFTSDTGDMKGIGASQIDSSDFTYIPHFPGAGGLQNPHCSIHPEATMTVIECSL